MRYVVRRDANGYACAIARDGIDVLHLISGSVKNVEHSDEIVAALNGSHACCRATGSVDEILDTSRWHRSKETAPLTRAEFEAVREEIERLRKALPRCAVDRELLRRLVIEAISCVDKYGECVDEPDAIIDRVLADAPQAETEPMLSDSPIQVIAPVDALHAAHARGVAEGAIRELEDLSRRFRRTGATLPAPDLTGTPEGGVVSGVCVALACVEVRLDELRAQEVKHGD